ncbi:hypothetical protein [Niveispirillum sp. BGYR6]|uniref:hypothetical protein n=1 Tax=Niveispirillum sp. BGYR6 TaxID=2971249 RepID=UPI0022B96387|nr:hypothetical protein [Niveispirillum sp. BGYR6]MDG5494572.1 hypothetical protein [Niveispirillum sp. BGYR6]
MKRATALAVTIASFMISGVAHAECALKDPPAVPDGASATEPDMVAAQKAVKAYVAETQEFLACLEFEGKGKSGGDWTKRYNDASARMEKLAADFNKQLRAYKSK